MEKITPEQAANETEALWEARAKGHLPTYGCGWCKFDADFGHKIACVHCPVRRLARTVCTNIAEYCEWRRTRNGKTAAEEVLRLLIKNRQRLLDAAREILSEQESNKMPRVNR